MTFDLHVDVESPGASTSADGAAPAPGLVPVAKGNGYGFGIDLLGAETGTPRPRPCWRSGPRYEVGRARRGLRRRHPRAHAVGPPHRPVAEPRPTIRTVGSVEALHALRASGATDAQVVVEVETSMHRHGVAHDRLLEVAPLLAGLTSRASPCTCPSPAQRSGAPRRPRRSSPGWGAGLRVERLWVSHLVDDRAGAGRGEHPAIESGRGSAPGCGSAAATPCAPRAQCSTSTGSPGRRYGYRQRKMPGGHAARRGERWHRPRRRLEAPRPCTAWWQEQGGRARRARGDRPLLSPFHVGGKQRWFAEPPHMQVLAAARPR